MRGVRGLARAPMARRHVGTCAWHCPGATQQHEARSLVPPTTDDDCRVAMFDHQDFGIFETRPFWEWFHDTASEMLFRAG
ncbi:hypothetical protein GCM10023205_02270 [Yinghuangia aomiensis]|uniref:Uncharacterized protein n=1 Tax=Yinghuangia aomiensis TaxID=676205 RepID=A0ABP9GJY7_9ACTN